MKEIGDILIPIDVNGTTEYRNLKEDLQVDGYHIDEILENSPIITAYWQDLYERQKTTVNKLKVALDRKKAQIGHDIRLYARAENERITDKAVEERVIINKEYQEIEDRLLEAQEQLNLLKAAVEALRERRSSLISLSANMRHSGAVPVPKTTNLTYEEKTAYDDSMRSAKMQRLAEMKKENTEEQEEAPAEKSNILSALRNASKSND